jgi:DNA-directed RNA polymerase subunit RPC12/RpoP
MRVIRSIIKEEMVRCKHCDSDLAYTGYDVFEKTFKKGGSYGYDEKVIQMIKCPVCGTNLKLCEFGRNFAL